MKDLHPGRVTESSAWRHRFIGGGSVGVTLSSVRASQIHLEKSGRFRGLLRSYGDDEGVTLSSVNMAVVGSRSPGGARLQDERDRVRPGAA